LSCEKKKKDPDAPDASPELKIESRFLFGFNDFAITL